MSRFFEGLENRQLLSVTPLLAPTVASPNTAAFVQPLAVTLTNIVGTYNGSISVQGVHTYPVTIKIATQAADGTFTGTLTSSSDSNLQTAVTGKVLTATTLTMSLSKESGHKGGSIVGTGQGTITQTATKTTLSLNFDFTQPFSEIGTITVSGPRTVTTSIVATPAAAQTGVAGVSKSFNLGSFTQTGATGPFTVDVDWGDGSFHTTFSQAAAGAIVAKAHTYTKAGANTLSVKITDSAAHTSNTATSTVTVTPAAANKLVVITQPGTSVAGNAVSPAVKVAVEDAFGNIVTTNTSTVTLAKLTGPTGSTLTGVLSAPAVAGVATFSALVLKTAGAYTLKATDGALASATTNSFNVTPAAASKLIITVQPAATVAGKAIAPAVKVAIQDAFGNVATTNTSTVTLAKNTGPTGSTITGTLTAAAVAGVATFSNVVLKTAGAYTLKVTDGALAAATSNSFNVTPAAAAKLVFTVQPAATTIAGKAIAPAVKVAIQDAFGNVVTTNTSTVTISKLTGPTGSTLTGTLTAVAVAGVATFSNLILKTAGAYTLKATDGTLTAATSTSLKITPAAAAKLVFTVKPATGTVNKALSAVKVAIQDAFGNVVTTNTSTVTIAKNTGPSGSTLTGTVSVAAIAGIATFSNLILNKAGSYTLKATDGVLTSVISGTIVIA